MSPTGRLPRSFLRSPNWSWRRQDSSLARSRGQDSSVGVQLLRQPLARVQDASKLKDFFRFLLFVYIFHVRECVDALPVYLVEVISQEGVLEEVVRAMHVESRQQRFLFVAIQFNRTDQARGGGGCHTLLLPFCTLPFSWLPSLVASCVTSPWLTLCPFQI